MNQIKLITGQPRHNSSNQNTSNMCPVSIGVSVFCGGDKWSVILGWFILVPVNSINFGIFIRYMIIRSDKHFCVLLCQIQ